MWINEFRHRGKQENAFVERRVSKVKAVMLGESVLGRQVLEMGRRRGSETLRETRKINSFYL